jgi:3'-phosphoadenosine 5'-phosphosulfate sulfotransferase (PAPS reductase)/FAD synthetase
MTYELSHLRALEAEAIHIVREVAAEFERPVLLFSGGKDSVVMLHVALKAFAPARLPFPVMHVDTGHNFDEVIEYRDRVVERHGLRLVVASVQDDIDAGRVIEETGHRASRNRLQTTTLLRAIEEHRFDAVFGGARRDEEKARVRFRTIGDATCTGAVVSGAATLDEVIAEVAAARQTERGTRADDKRSETAMEDGRRRVIFNMDLLRFTTAGSVDDGKSTLIGRLLYDSKSIFEDQLEAIERSSRQRGDENVNLALLTDGLRAEREQGITIDVAYRYFATPRRKFIIADTPGHIQYTRNMVTGASTANLAILVDARKGVIEQTCRHSFIANLLRIQHVVSRSTRWTWSAGPRSVYEKIKADFQSFASRLDGLVEITFIPISALLGDNIVDKSANMPWYQGPTLLYHLETVYVGAQENHVDARFPVQWVIRPMSDAWHDFRGYAGRVAGGVFKPGDEVVVLPSGFAGPGRWSRTCSTGSTSTPCTVTTRRPRSRSTRSAG